MADRPARRTPDPGRGPGRRRPAVRRARPPMLRLGPGPARRGRLRCGGGRDRRAPARPGSPCRSDRRLGRPVRDPVGKSSRRPRLAGGDLPRASGGDVRPARRRGSPGSARHEAAVDRLQLVRRRPPLAGRPEHGSPDTGRRAHPCRRPRDLPRASSRACLEGDRARGAAGPARVEHSSDQHPGVPRQRGSGGPRASVRIAGRGRGRSPRRALRAGRAGHRARSGRRPGRRDDERGPRRPAPAPERVPGQRRPDAPRRRRLPRRGPRLARAGGPVCPVGRGQAPRVHRASALADVCLRLPRGRGASAALARGGPRSGTTHPVRTAPARTAQPDGHCRRAGSSGRTGRRPADGPAGPLAAWSRSATEPS